MINGDPRPACAVGLYRTPDRAKLGKFTLPIFFSLPHDFVVRSDNPKIQHTDSMTSLLANPAVRMVLRNGYSYGASVDAMLNNANAVILRPYEDSHGRIKLVLAGMVDVAMFTPEEVDYLIKQFGDEGKVLAVKHFNDSPAGEPTYVYCNMSVDDEVINALNHVLKKEHNK